MMSRGDLPSPTQRLAAVAAAQGQECDKYYLLTPNNDVMCKDEDGNIIADNLEDRDGVCYTVLASIRQ